MDLSQQPKRARHLRKASSMSILSEDDDGDDDLVADETEEAARPSLISLHRPAYLERKSTTNAMRSVKVGTTTADINNELNLIQTG